MATKSAAISVPWYKTLNRQAMAGARRLEPRLGVLLERCSYAAAPSAVQSKEQEINSCVREERYRLPQPSCRSCGVMRAGKEVCHTAYR
jgi:hypothetical protein